MGKGKKEGGRNFTARKGREEKGVIAERRRYFSGKRSTWGKSSPNYFSGSAMGKSCPP